jgi:hypothetical protein
MTSCVYGKPQTLIEIDDWIVMFAACTQHSSPEGSKVFHHGKQQPARS